MAKHPHRLMLVNSKTWKCTLPGCSFFVHLGLQYVLEGKNAVCWECGEVFTVDARSLKDDMPKCVDCRLGTPSPHVASQHAADCEIYDGLLCTCGVASED